MSPLRKRKADSVGVSGLGTSGRVIDSAGTAEDGHRESRKENDLLPYNDDYPTCRKTYATLRIYGEAVTPEQITELLHLEPSRAQVKGRTCTRRWGGEFVPDTSAWFFSTECYVTSRDIRRHIDWIGERIVGKADVLSLLRSRGHWIDVFCYWESAEGQGGPMLSPANLRWLADLDIGIGFDVYGPFEEDEAEPCEAIL